VLPFAAVAGAVRVLFGRGGLPLAGLLGQTLGGQLLNRSTPIAEASLRGLHPRSIAEATEIHRLLERARGNGCVFHRGLNSQADLESAHLERVELGKLFFETSNFERDFRDQVFLNFSLDVTRPQSSYHSLCWSLAPC
jgi:hypothetical protein